MRIIGACHWNAASSILNSVLRNGNYSSGLCLSGLCLGALFLGKERPAVEAALVWVGVGGEMSSPKPAACAFFKRKDEFCVFKNA